MSQPPWGYERLVLVTVGHAPSLVFWAISCHFLSFVLVSHFYSCVLSVFSDILRGISLQTWTRPLLVQHTLFYVRYRSCLPPAAFGPQELVINENKTRGSRDQLALGDSCLTDGGVYGSALHWRPLLG
jgi:hypothetical protein